MSALFSYARVSGCIFGIFTICAIYWDRSNSFFICFPKAPIFLPLLTSAKSSSLMFIKYHIIVRYRIQMQALQFLTDTSLMESVCRLLLSRLPKHRFCESQWHEREESQVCVCVCVCVCLCTDTDMCWERKADGYKWTERERKGNSS